MAFYRLEAKVFSREKRGRSIIAAAAYRAGTKLQDERDGRIFDYARRVKGVVDTTILAPDGAPSWMRNPAQLWNAVEAGEKRVDAQLAREFILAVPPELSPKAQFATARDWAEKELVATGMVAEISLHHSRTGNNPHVHILCTLRKAEADGFSAKKPREWNDVGFLVKRRESWAEAVNAALEQAGRPERVDHRSLKERGIDRKPEPKIGIEATAMNRRGVEEDPKRFQEARRVRLENEVRPLMRHIQRDGDVKQHGVGRQWWEKSIIFMGRLRKQARQWVRKTWAALVGPGRSRGRDDGPDISR